MKEWCTYGWHSEPWRNHVWVAKLCEGTALSSANFRRKPMTQRNAFSTLIYFQLFKGHKTPEVRLSPVCIVERGSCSVDRPKRCLTQALLLISSALSLMLPWFPQTWKRDVTGIVYIKSTCRSPLPTNDLLTTPFLSFFLSLSPHFISSILALSISLPHSFFPYLSLPLSFIVLCSGYGSFFLSLPISFFSSVLC